MRIAFFNTLFEAAKKDSRIILLTGDLGYSVFEPLAAALPRQFLNMGVAEQNMAGVAAGLAMEGYIPVVYSIVPFVVMRNFEQIRNDICYQNLNVKIVGVGAGFSYAAYGRTHHGLEDIGILRTMPNLTIFAPGDPVEVTWVTQAALVHRGPVYIRLGKAGEPVVHINPPRFQIGHGIVVYEGKDATLFATSTMLARGLEVVGELAKQNIRIRLVSMHTIRPLDHRIIIESAKKTQALFTLEEHSIIGGLGSAVAEVVAETGLRVLFKRIGASDHFTRVMGRQEFMRRANGLTVRQIIGTIQTTLKARHPLT